MIQMTKPTTEELIKAINKRVQELRQQDAGFISCIIFKQAAERLAEQAARIEELVECLDKLNFEGINVRNKLKNELVKNKNSDFVIHLLLRFDENSEKAQELLKKVKGL